MRLRILFSMILLLVGMASYAQVRFRDHVVIFKLKDEFRSSASQHAIELDQVQEALLPFGEVKISKKFPKAQAPTINRGQVSSAFKTDISLIYELSYERDVSPFKVIAALMRTHTMEYAEPAYISEPLYVPSDQLLFKQWHLDAINAYEAWDIEQGSEDVVMAIIDTGVDWDHPDLKDALELNDADPEDGVDNDSNGYVDDYLGWNFYEDNNNPDELGWSHGTHVGGLAGASTDNNVGGAGTGFNSKILAIKAGNQQELTHGYEGIIYAVDRDADVINCSWGSTAYTEFGHDIVRFATERGKLVICGAGNNNNDLDFYPASYPVAMSVAATDSLTNKAIFSSFNYHVDISAPGQAVYSTKNGTYDYDNGTSMSAPIVTGAAALVLNRFPGLTPAQLKAQLVETATNIDNVNDNAQYANRLGSGLLNMETALDSLVEVSIGIENYLLTDNQDEVFVIGDEISLGIELVNYFSQTESIEVQLIPIDTIITLIEGVKNFAALGVNGRVNNFSNPFLFTVNDRRGYNEEVDLKLVIKSGDYERVEHIQMIINPDFVNVTVNDIATTVSSQGHIGYANNQRSYGLGFQFETEGNFLYEAGLMIGTPSFGYNKVVDRIRGVEYQTERDFWPMQAIEIAAPIEGEAFNAIGRFSDTSAISDEMGLEILQRAYAFNDEGHRHYMVIEYTIVNVSDQDITDLYAGMYADWDIRNAVENRGETAFAKRLGYIYSSSDVPYTAGIQQLNADQPFFSYMIDNSNNGSGGVNISGVEGFTTDEKLFTLQNNQFKRGQEELGTDVSHVVSSGAYAIAKGDSVTVAFAFLAAKNTDDLLRYADESYKRYNGYAPGENIYAPIQSLEAFPNPTTGNVRLEFDLKNRTRLEFNLYAINGELCRQFDSETFYAGPNMYQISVEDLVPGLYFLEVIGDDINEVLKISRVRP